MKRSEATRPAALTWAGIAIVIATFVLAVSYSRVPGARAADGDNLASFDATATAGIPSCGIGTGIAYDVTTDSLVLSCWFSNVLERVDAVTHTNDGAVTVTGLPYGDDLGALAYDAGRDRLWACNADSHVVLIDIQAGAVDASQPTIDVPGCIDGLAYDGNDDTLWVSEDVANTVYHYDLDGNVIGSFDAVSLLGGSCGNSGIAVGGPKLYLANNGCSEIYEAEKDGSAATLFASFPARLEDLECDSETFAADGVGAIWSIDASDRTVNAWEIPAGQCASGGGGGPTEHPGTIDSPFACGTYVRGGEDSGYQTDPDTYDFVIPSPLGISGAGTFADHHWVHSVATEDNAFVVFDMGAPVPAAFYIPSIDHEPIPGEAMEATLYGTNNLSDPEGTWEAGTISDIYDQGVDAAWISDDFSTRWTFSQSYRYIGILHGGPGAIVDDGDAEIDAVCAEGSRVDVTKFYDANTNGIQDNDEPGIPGWTIVADESSATTGASGGAAFVLQEGDHTIAEGTPVQGNWHHTTAASVDITVPGADTVAFGNVCVGAGGGLTLGFWSNKNGQALVTDADLAFLRGLNLRNATAAFDPTTKAQLKSWLLSATANPMSYMLSAQLAAMELNVRHGFVSGSALIYAPGTTSANAAGFATVDAVMAEANAALANALATKAYLGTVKDALDNANNNKSFVQAEACAFSF